MRNFLLAGLSVVALSASAQMTMTSSSMLVSGDCNCYRLTAPTGGADKGAIWSPVPIDLTDTFDMTFDIYCGVEDVFGGDGMVFVLQQNPTGIGDFANTLGYKDVLPAAVPPISAKSLGIEIDTYGNAPSVATDIASDHIGLNSNGSNDHNLVAPIAIPNIEDGAYHTLRVVWIPALQTLSVVLDGNFIFAYTNDIVTNIFTGNPSVYFGFTAATGGSINEYRVCMHRNAAFTSDITTVCPDLPVTFTDNSTSELNNIIEYVWDFGDGTPIDMTQNPSHNYTTPGTYTATLYMTDVSGCNDSAMVDITVLPDLILDMTSTDVSCFGNADGTGTASPQNGTGPYDYTWNDPLVQTTSTATDLAPNATYTVTVVDDLGCVGIDSVTIAEPTELMVTIHGSDALCNGANDGTAQAIGIGGTGTYDYLWDDPTAQTTELATGLAPGTYNVTITDDNGCISTGTVTIAEPSEIVITGLVTYDNGTTNGAIDASITGGTTPYASTVWSNSATTEDITDLAAGSYTITVTDANGCTKDTTFSVKSSVGIDEPSTAVFQIFPNPSNGQFQIIAKGYYEFVITDAAGRMVVANNATNNYSLDLGKFESGVYFIQLKKDGVEYTERIVIQH